MIRVLVLSGVFALCLTGLLGARPPAPLVEWQWDDGQPKFEATGQKLGDTNTYKLSASGLIIFEGKDNSVNKDKTEFYVYLAPPETPNTYPQNPNVKFTVTVGELTKLPPTDNRYYFKITAITTVNGKADGDPYPFLEGYKAKVVPVITYQLGSDEKAKDRTSQFDPPGYATATK
ncbi:MAG: hypothetical protein K2V38_17545 [Gemmataceae bacterium]|nr:hypothetical protein [Gemmataceae bacterium]